MTAYEINFDGIVGPTHNYSGLSYGNVASVENRALPSNPKQAALQGLAKMKFLMDLGIPQGVLPPQERPHIPTLRALGFEGSDAQVLEKAFQQAPDIFFACCSASSMWTANAATVTPSTDTQDGRVHFTAANLCNKFHRSIEPTATALVLQKIFQDPSFFAHHPPLPSSNSLSDEGAANHNHFCKEPGQRGVHLFVYGRHAFGAGTEPARYPARQTDEASHTIARTHLLNHDQAVFAKQNPVAIDAGVFHNDVISVGHENVFFYHELAFAESSKVLNELKQKVSQQCNTELILIPVSSSDISLEDAVKSYLFNSQIITLPDRTMSLIAPSECEKFPQVKAFINRMIQDQSQPIRKVHYFNLRESMRNGGGPACLRLRVVLTEKELAAMHQAVLLTPKLYEKLVDWVDRNYRDRLLPQDLIDPELLKEGQKALGELSELLRIYFI